MANNQILASDNFASGSLATGWSAALGLQKSKVVIGTPNVAEANTVGTQVAQSWTGLTWPNDQSSELTVQAMTAESGTVLGLYVRQQPVTFAGYYFNLNNGTWSLHYFDGTTNHSLDSGTTDVIAGDVFVLQAAGSIISVYQNDSALVYISDTNVPSGGFPGFDELVANSLSDLQVSSWRGYSAVQQDGVWTKHGVSIPGTSAAFSTGEGTSTPCVIYDTNAQILSGTVFKMWYCSGQQSADLVGDVWYAESSDGVNWTQYSGNPVLSGYLAPVVLKVGSTYYLYAQPASGPSTANFAAFTSADGIHWSLQNSNVIGLGAGGSWDAAGLWQFCPVAVIGGVWYALYTAGGSGQPYYANIGLATSANGLTGWTKYVGNPVIQNFGIAGNPFFSPDGGTTWYVWGGSSLLGGGGPKPNLDPLEGFRYKVTSNFTAWSEKTKSIHSTQSYEAYNSTVSGTYIAAILSKGNQTYAWSNIGTDGNTIPEYQIALQTVPTVLATLVTQPEDGAQQVATDSFPTPGNFSSNWVVTPGFQKLTIASTNTVEVSTLNANCGMLYSGASFSQNQYSEITIAALASGSTFTPFARGSLVTGYGYYAVLTGPVGTADTTCSILRYSSSSGQIGPTNKITVQAGDVIRLQVVDGSDGFPVVSLFQNGFLVIQCQDHSPAALTSGSPGMYAYVDTMSAADSKISEWVGGNANVIPSIYGRQSISSSIMVTSETKIYPEGRIFGTPRTLGALIG